MNTHENYWIVRDPKFHISGPMSRAELVDKVKKQEIDVDYEIAHSAGYWFKVENKEEIRRLLPELLGDVERLVQDKTEIDVKEKTSKIYLDGESSMDGTSVAQKKRMKVQEEFTVIGGEPSGNVSKGSSMEILNEPRRGPKRKFMVEEEEKFGLSFLLAWLKKEKKKAIGFSCFLLILLVSGISWFVQKPATEEDIKQASIETDLNKFIDLKGTFLLNQAEGARRILSDLENNKSIEWLMARALFNSHFLFNSREAIRILKTTENRYSKKMDKKEALEIHNLIGIYSLDWKPSQALYRLQLAQVLAPKDFIIQYNYGLALVMSKKYSEARQHFNLIALKIKDVHLLSQVYFMLGTVRNKESKENYQKALEYNPFYGEARIMLALDQWGSREFEKSRNNFQLFLNGLPGFVDELNVKNYRKGKINKIYDKARNKVRDLLINQKPDALLLSVEGMLSLLLGDHEKAIRSFERSLGLEPGNIYALNGIAYFKLKEGKEAEIEALLLEKTRDNENNFASSVLLGQSYLKQGKYKEAAIAYTQMTKEYSNFSYAWSWLGLSVLSLGNKGQSLDFFKNARKRNPLDSVVLEVFTRVQNRFYFKPYQAYNLFPF